MILIFFVVVRVLLLFIVGCVMLAIEKPNGWVSVATVFASVTLADTFFALSSRLTLTLITVVSLYTPHTNLADYGYDFLDYFLSKYTVIWFILTLLFAAVCIPLVLKWYLDKKDTLFINSYDNKAVGNVVILSVIIIGLSKLISALSGRLITKLNIAYTAAFFFEWLVALPIMLLIANVIVNAVSNWLEDRG